jgi:uncharacterized membrane protein
MQASNPKPSPFSDANSGKSGSRIPLLDVARGTALIAMAIYHFSWDLEFFGYLEPGLTSHGGWKIFARCIAGSFLFLVGISLVLAHRNGIRWRPFFKRLAMIAAGAIAVTIATLKFSPHSFVFFGILHNITVSSVLGLAFLRLPAFVTALAGFLVVLLAPYLHSSLFDWPGLIWIGLSTYVPRSNDFVPMFPWFGAVLLGIATGRIMLRTDGFKSLATLYEATDKAGRTLVFFGRHGLAFYLIHQPMLVAVVYIFSLVFPPAQPSQESLYIGACVPACSQNQSEQYCKLYCQCTLEGLMNEGVFDLVMSNAPDLDSNPIVQRVVGSCSLSSEGQPGR